MTDLDKKKFEEARQKWRVEQRILQETINRGSQYPPFSIEPMPNERQRTVAPMTAEERAARKQWVMDQKLAPNEPRNLNWSSPGQYPHDVKYRNALRRFYMKPMDNFIKAITPMVGQRFATVARKAIPALGGLYAAALSVTYYMKYNTNTWENMYGVGIYKSKDPAFADPADFPESSDFNDRGFKGRQCLLDHKTSRNSEMSTVKYFYEK
ncbi:hypothetical protein KUTeg_017018 [Tegillarca granosa]|uniref:NADH dehydrogenase [ubiquinone] 1 beta subcomplex subunit 6 n=1 Tax=Tegillarca granosa TaxID=220873 RepID=A0ABQ9EMK8_TEGGR|nr:hypothetical protein KUTeg_017018 [Tegillarca granosa]